MEELMAKYLVNELSEKKRAAFESQLVDNEQVKNEFEDYLNLWHESATPDEVSFDAGQAWSAMPMRKAPKGRIVSLERKPHYTFLKIAATILIVMTAGYFLSDSVQETFSNITNTSSLSVVSTGAEMKEFELPDGSVIKLNGNSELSYKKGFGTEHRNVTLTGGANFDVQRNETLPFIIKAEASQVEVLGTNFDVNAYPGKDIQLNVMEGEVQFSSIPVITNSDLVKAGERAVLSEDGTKMDHGKVESRNYAGWWTRKLVFENTSFPDAISDLENTYWVKIDFDKALSGCALTATIDNKSLDSALKILETTFIGNQLKVVRTKENQIKLEGKACAN